ncbi:hypothetical protein SAMN05216333_14014 [Nitrosomonas oligotropha]|uniref:Uncharacterized protein n=1 Tax=Nitrosomonas oligotropha TaxID=42354 RepID=A0A1H8UUI9_9PROT|nr:hypothetical protein SAMN05216300_14214 [Nitrosomonas oligotropha]SEP06594.1 hypothetical protein SAMN05216333_14014 [Nitrosomonas oligotropha]
MRMTTERIESARAEEIQENQFTRTFAALEKIS